MPFHILPLNGFELISLQAMPDSFRKASDLFPNSDPQELKRLQAEMPAYLSEDAESIRMNLSVFAIRKDGEITLIDTGIPLDHERSNLLQSFQEAGITSDQVTKVILTHGDMDHVGGMATKGVPSYPNATYYINESQFEMLKTTGGDNWENAVKPVEAAGKLQITKDDAEVAPGFQLVETPGHRQGAVSVLVFNQAIVVGDTWHSPIQVVHPEWNGSFDADAETSVKTRKAIMDRARAANLVAAVPHIPEGGLGRIEGTNWVPVV